MKRVISSLIAFCVCIVAIAQDTHQLLLSEISKGFVHPTVLANASTDNDTANDGYIIRSDMNEFTITNNGVALILHSDFFRLLLLNKYTKAQWQLDTVLLDGKPWVNKITAIHQNKDSWSFTTGTISSKVYFDIKLLKNGIFLFSARTTNPSIKNMELIFHGNGPFFGGGERFIGTVLNGRSFNNNPNDKAWIPDSLRTNAYLSRSEHTYLPIPFIYTPTGLGLYVDNADSTTIHLQQADEGRFSVNINNNQAAIYFFSAPNPKQLLSAYTYLVGRTPMPPKWAFGVWLNLLKGQDSVIYRANELRRLNIPSDVLWLFDFDDPESNTGWTLWTNGYYGNLRSLTDTLHRLNFKVLTYLRSYVDTNLSYYNFPNPVYQYAKANNFILPHKLIDEDTFSNFHSNAQVNFYNDKAVDWWKMILKRNLVDENFDGWMEDFGDVNYVYHKKKLYYTPMEFHLDKPLNALTNDQVADLYPLIYHKITHQLSVALKPDVVEFSRSGSAGSAAYEPIIWGGDQDPSWSKTYGYPSAITAGLSAGLSGYSIWAPDILCLSPSRELWMRWVEFGAMTSIMRDHLWDYAPQNIRIWTDSSTLLFFKKYATLHEALKDYLYETAKQSTQAGLPVMRHLMLEYSTDTTTYHLEYEYMLGDAILVAPVVEEHATTERVYLPEGNWKYYWTNKTYTGKAWVNVDAPASEIPFFIKEGAEANFTLPKPE